jgi:drug/metabolite transporter (DMT)-like permease
MAASSAILLIPGILLWPAENPSPEAWVSALLLAVVCTAFAFLLFFRILASSGAIASSTVTFLVPLFAIGWGVLLLDESLTVRLIVGMCITLCGTAITVQLIKLQNPLRKLTGN